MKIQLPAAAVAMCALASLMGMLPAVSVAGQLVQQQRPEGVLVYVGIKPAAVIKQHPKVYPELHVQGAVPNGRNQYYVSVALFDKSSGEPISNAAVNARVSPLALAGPKKKLRPVYIAGTVTYGNYFDLAGAGSYIIKVEIRQLEKPDLVQAKFEYKHTRN